MSVVEDAKDLLPIWKPHADTGAVCTGSLLWHDREGPVWVAECDKCRETFGVPRREVDPDYEIELLTEAAKLPSSAFRVWERTPGTENARELLHATITDWPNTRPPLLIGRPGIGKTHLLGMTTLSIIHKHRVPTLYATLGNLLAAAKLAMNEKHPDESAQAIFHRAATVPLLVLDDIGAERPTPWMLDCLASLVDQRYQANRPIMGATNLPLTAMTAAFGERTASRLAEMTSPIEVTGSDRRRT